LEGVSRLKMNLWKERGLSQKLIDFQERERGLKAKNSL